MTFLDCWKVLNIPSNLISSEKMVICHIFGIKVCKFVHDFLVSWFWTLKVSRVMLRKLNYGLNFIFTPLSNLFHSCGNVTIVNKGLQNLDVCPSLTGAVTQGPWVCGPIVSSEGPHPYSPFDKQRVLTRTPCDKLRKRFSKGCKTTDKESTEMYQYDF